MAKKSAKVRGVARDLKSKSSGISDKKKPASSGESQKKLFGLSSEQREKVFLWTLRIFSFTVKYFLFVRGLQTILYFEAMGNYLMTYWLAFIFIVITFQWGKTLCEKAWIGLIWFRGFAKDVPVIIIFVAYVAYIARNIAMAFSG